MIRKLLKKFGWNDSDKKPEEYTEKPTHENISQSVKEKEEPAKVNPPTNTKIYVNNSQSVESIESTKVNRSDDIDNDLRASEWKTGNVKERKINIFVSSTFKDMHVERDELVKRIFPQLRKLCEERGLTWGEVDLRWGITDEQKAEGKVLPICLAEIEHCRPYFIGILGERYGWVDDEIPQAVVEQYEWLNEYKGKSVTELEILHGVLRNPEMADHAFFYFRDPSYLNSIAENELTDYIEVPTVEDIQKYGLEEAERRAEEKKKKLVELKESIKNSGFPVKENYSNPKTLGELVFQDLKDVIDGLYPAGEKLDPLEQARFEHQSFAESSFNIYIERKEYFDRLDAHVKDNDLPLVVVGDSGSGKSALLANWAKRYKEKGDNKPFLLVHYIGATPDSVDWESMLRRIMGEMKLHFDIQQDIPKKRDKLKTAFANWLHMIAAKGRMVLVIDALNQLEDRDGAIELFWLPESIPPNVRLIVSSLPGRSLDELNKRGWPTLKVKPLDVQERKKLIVDYLKQYYKSLSPKVVENIVAYSQTSNPLYLRALLEEIRLHGDHFTLLERIDHYLAATTVDDLYYKILERYEHDYDRDRENLVRDTFSYLWAARKGLSEIELREMLGTISEPLPGALWSPLYLAAEKSLVNRSGLLSFSHDYLRIAVKKRYLNEEVKEQRYHLFLADYFEKMTHTERGVDELLWQLAQTKSWGRLAVLLSISPLFEIAWDLNEFDVKRYWALIEDNSEISIIEAYKFIIDSPLQEEERVVSLVSILLRDTGHLLESFSINKSTLEYYRAEGEKPPNVILGNQAVNLTHMGDIDGAMKLLKEQERICRETVDKNTLLCNLGNRAAIIMDNNPDGAMKLLKEQESICREIGNKSGLAASLGLQGLILKDKGDIEGAMKLYNEGESICRETGNINVLQETLGNHGFILYFRNDIEGAMKLLKEQESICREIGNKSDLETCLFNQSSILKAKGDIDGAMKLYKEQESICREIGKEEGLQASFDNQANILYSRGNIEDARKLSNENETESILNEFQISLGNRASILSKRGDLDSAMKLYEEQERICRELGNKYSLAISLTNQLICLTDSNHPRAGLLIAEKAFKIANDNGYITLAKQIESKLEDIMIESLAMFIHEEFRIDNDGWLCGDDPRMQHWDTLREELRTSNREHAKKIRSRLQKIGFDFRPCFGKPIKRFEFSEEQIEIMAEMDHERFVRERLEQGWRYGSKRDLEKKTSPYLVPWSELSEEVKNWDRNAVREIPGLLEKAGVEVYTLQ